MHVDCRVTWNSLSSKTQICVVCSLAQFSVNYTYSPFKKSIINMSTSIRCVLVKRINKVGSPYCAIYLRCPIPSSSHNCLGRIFTGSISVHLSSKNFDKSNIISLYPQQRPFSPDHFPTLSNKRKHRENIPPPSSFTILQELYRF